MIKKLFVKFNLNITNLFMINTPSIIKNRSGEDTGLRGNIDGSLTVDKAVFFNRPKVQELLKEIKKTTVAISRKK